MANAPVTPATGGGLNPDGSPSVTAPTGSGNLPGSGPGPIGGVGAAVPVGGIGSDPRRDPSSPQYDPRFDPNNPQYDPSIAGGNYDPNARRGDFTGGRNAARTAPGSRQGGLGGATPKGQKSQPVAKVTEGEQEPVSMTQFAHGLLVETRDMSNQLTEPLPSYNPPMEDLANPFDPDAGGGEEGGGEGGGETESTLTSIIGTPTVDNAAADGVAENNASFVARDQDDLPMVDVQLDYTTDSATAVLSAQNGPTDASGDATVGITNTVAESVVVTATATSTGGITGSATVVFTDAGGTRTGENLPGGGANIPQQS